MKTINFSAGPAILPQEVIKEAAKAIIDYENTGLSILEVSHRSKAFVKTMEESIQLVKLLYNLSDEYEVVFLTGGASSQFYMIPMNLLDENESAGYICTGSWAKNAIKEAKAFGDVKVLATSEDSNFNFIPKSFEIPDTLRYLHLTSNNTIFGTQFHKWPETNVKFVCDMSSDIFSRPINIEKFDLIYAGAQKNMGPAGCTLVIVKKEILGKVKRYIPTMLKYETHIENGSMYNTPPVYAIYVSMLTMKWVMENGGLEGIEIKNQAKAQILYDEIDRNNMFKGHSVAEDRSLMNVCFRLNDETLENEFNELCNQANLDGLKGHRSVGGYRASIYNAMPIEGVQKLVEVMQNFEKEKG
jgi:phosphoserine aminotransferase